MQLDLSTLFLLLLLIAAVAYWRNAMAARERVLSAARRAAEQVNAQLLDQTVSMERMKLHRQPSGWLGLRRFYRFEFSLVGDDRRVGRVIVDGQRIRYCEMQMPDGNLILD